MPGLSIGEMARRAGVSTSALRYYEKARLLPPPARESGRRRYGRQVLGRIRIILLARGAGFTIEETRIFLEVQTPGATPAARWRLMAKKKIAELDVIMARVAQMKVMLESEFRCGCQRLDDCEKLMAAKATRQTAATPAWLAASKESVQRLRLRK
jgi:MerR family redox-sensitive transcriptional activator SoxR